MAKDLVLELDAIRIAGRGRARADIQDEVDPLAQNFFECSAERIALVLARDLFDRAVEESRDAGFDAKFAETFRALQIGPAEAEFTAAAGGRPESKGGADSWCRIGRAEDLNAAARPDFFVA